MTDHEKRKQAIEDSFEINRFFKYDLHKRWAREAKKFTKFPRLFKLTYLTKNKNKYHMLLRVERRSDIDKPGWVHTYTIMDSNEGKYAMIAVTIDNRVESFQIYAPHLFTRYSERYGCDMYGEERIHRFMEEATEVKYGGVKEYEKGKVMSVVKGGVILGDIEGDIIVFKTFVDDDRLFENQVEIGEKMSNQFAERTERLAKMYKKIK